MSNIVTRTAADCIQEFIAPCQWQAAQRPTLHWHSPLSHWQTAPGPKSSGLCARPCRCCQCASGSQRRQRSSQAVVPLSPSPCHWPGWPADSAEWELSLPMVPALPVQLEAPRGDHFCRDWHWRPMHSSLPLDLDLEPWASASPLGGSCGIVDDLDAAAASTGGPPGPSSSTGGGSLGERTQGGRTGAWSSTSHCQWCDLPSSPPYHRAPQPSGHGDSILPLAGLGFEQQATTDLLQKELQGTCASDLRALSVSCRDSESESKDVGAPQVVNAQLPFGYAATCATPTVAQHEAGASPQRPIQATMGRVVGVGGSLWMCIPVTQTGRRDVADSGSSHHSAAKAPKLLSHSESPPTWAPTWAPTRASSPTPSFGPQDWRQDTDPTDPTDPTLPKGRGSASEPLTEPRVPSESRPVAGKLTAGFSVDVHWQWAADDVCKDRPVVASGAEASLTDPLGSICRGPPRPPSLLQLVTRTEPYPEPEPLTNALAVLVQAHAHAQPRPAARYDADDAECGSRLPEASAHTNPELDVDNSTAVEVLPSDSKTSTVTLGCKPVSSRPVAQPGQGRE